jgi:DNA-binding NarL/FixJ family response regulator
MSGRENGDHMSGDIIRVIPADPADDHSVVRAGLRSVLGIAKDIEVAHGDGYVRPPAARVLAKALSKKEPAASERARFDKLTQREQDVLRYVAQGYSAPEIGAKLSISPKTVDTYKQRIQEKLGLAHRSDYVQLALKLGLLVET